jgi:hypothetical protein
MIEPPVSSSEELKVSLLVSIEEFRRERIEEPLEDYLEAFDDYLGTTEELLETSVDLTQLEQQALAILSDKRLLHVLRYLAGPPISVDDLKTLTDTRSLAPSTLRKNPALVRRLIETVMIGLDRRRFPWVQEGREPNEAERSAAVLASAALMATQRVGTKRRSASKVQQETRVEQALVGASFTKVPTRTISTLEDAPGVGEFCRESLLGTRKADFVVRLWDRRVMAIECKVSNSSTNSVKRLNNDAAVKAVAWRHEFGDRQVVPTAVLSGVYKLHNLEHAQERGLTLFWAHDLPKLLEWIEDTRGA